VRVLHVASFCGNIGDNANHAGFRPWFERLARRPVEWTELEIREFYWKERAFDESFVELANAYDLLVFGGGNYFELWVERSHTGTSIDIPPDHLARIRPPMFFNALGCDAGQGTSENTVRRFNGFIAQLLSSDRALVTVRNDGAQKTLRRFVPAALADQIATIPDGGFFMPHEPPAAPHGRKQIGINLACDMPEVRFAGHPGGLEAFCREFAAVLGAVAAADSQVDFVFFPHIYSDMKIIAAVLAQMGDRLRRTRTTVAPYLTGAAGAAHIFGLYRRCKLIVGMRFHANVCALGMGIPAVGLNNYSQIELLYDELGSPERCLDVKQPGFAGALQQRMLAPPDDGARVLGEVRALRAAFEPRLTAWLEHHFSAA
jgi:hypothetical protein